MNDERPFAERSWHTCWSCRYDESRGSNGCPPWHSCTILSHEHRRATHEGETCDRYSPLPWAKSPTLNPPVSNTDRSET